MPNLQKKIANSRKKGYQTTPSHWRKRTLDDSQTKRSDVDRYVERLIAADLLAAKSFDEILAPIRRTFQESGMSEDDLDALFDEARDEVYQEGKARQQ
jgi:hypothetical protein